MLQRIHALPRREHLLLCLFIFAEVLTLSHFVHEAYGAVEATVAPQLVECAFGQCPGVRYAPTAYRVGVAVLGTWIIHVFHVRHFSWVYTFFDFVFFLPALYLLGRAAAMPAAALRWSVRQQQLSLLGFCAVSTFAMYWVVPWQRAETAPAALFVASVIFWVASPQKTWRGVAVLALLAVWQGFVRADVPVITGFALAVLALGNRLRSLGSRRLLSMAGTAIALCAGLVQLYLQFVRYPHLSYEPGVPVVMLSGNLHSGHMLGVALIVVLPILLLLLPGTGEPGHWDSLATFIALASVLYACLWISVGILQEARLYVPFLLALSVVVARSLANYLIRESDSEPA